MRVWFRFGLLVGMVLAASSAQAQTRDPARAEKLFEEARGLVKAGKYDGACPRFADSQRLDPAAGTLMNLADCEEHINKFLDARQHWRELVQSLPVTGDQRRALAQQRLDDLQKKIPQLTIWLTPETPPSSTVVRDGTELASSALGIADDVDPGIHEVIARAPGYQDKRYLVTVHPSQHLDQVVEPGARATPPPFTVPTAPPTVRPAPPPASTVRPAVPAVSAKPPAAPAPKKPAEKESTTTHKLGHWGIGLGATTMGVGVIMGGLALMKKVSLLDSCPDHHCPEEQRDNYDTARGLAAWSTGTVIVGGALLTAGIVLVSLPQGAKSSTPALTVGAGPNQISIQGWY